METNSYQEAILSMMVIYTKPISAGVLLAFLVGILLLICSALVSGAEAAFFSLTPAETEYLRKSKSKACQIVLKLLDIPDHLLATILVANNFINVSIVIIAAFITNALFDFTEAPVLGFVIQVLVITSVIVFIGEIFPKVYANRYALRFVRLMAAPLNIAEKIFRPLNLVLIRSTSLVNKKFSQRRKNISIDELSDALELTEKNLTEDKEILKGIVKFGNIDVREIMTSRVDVIGARLKTPYRKLLKLIVESGYSRFYFRP